MIFFQIFSQCFTKRMVVRVAFLHLAILIQSSSCLGHGLPCVCKRNTLASFRDSVFFWYNEQSDHSIIIKSESLILVVHYKDNLVFWES